MEKLTTQRLRLALKVLSSRYDPKVEVTTLEIDCLKSCLDGDLAGMAVDDIATMVIQQELERQKSTLARAAG